MVRLLSFGALLIGFLFLLTACPSDKKAGMDYYCAPGFHLAPNGRCLPDSQIDGDVNEVVDTAEIDTVEATDKDTVELEREAPEGDTEPDNSDGDVSEVETYDEDTDQNDADQEEEIDYTPISFCLTVYAPENIAVGAISKLSTRLFVCETSRNVTDYSIALQGFDANKLKADRLDASSQSYSLQGLAESALIISVRASVANREVVIKDILLSVLPRNKVEARGLWVNRWAFAGDKTQGPKDIATIMTKAKNAHFNQVYFQVRGTFDAYYDSQYEPWAARLSGTLGTDPGWDPLAVAIAEAHNRGLELHAWINVFTLWASTTAPTDSSHALVKYPGWVMCDASGTPMMALVDSYIWASPGNPYVRQHNTAVVTDIATRYDVDGVHLDRVRYPGTAYSHDEASVTAYNAALASRPGLSFADWEREQVVAQVAEMYAALKEKAPKVALSAAVIGIYKDVWGWGSVSEGYYDSLQDSRAFDAQGTIDALMPMVYWPCTGTGSRADFCAIATDWGATKSRALMIIGADLDAAKSALDTERPIRRKAGYESFAQITSQITATRTTNGVDGWALYDYGTMESADYWAQLLAGPFAEEAVVPFMWWK